MLNKPLGHLYIVAAPSGAGKTSLVAATLEKLPNLQVSISHTTRPPRINEVHGKSYFFISKDEFIQKIADKDFLEHAEVFNHYYGTTKTWVQQRLAEGVDVILEIDWQGARQIKLSYPEAVGIFILPPTLATLRQRLEGRAEDDPAVIAHRLTKPREEIKHYPEYDYLIVNDDFNTALEQLAAIIICRRLTTTKQSYHYADLVRALQ